MLKMYRQCAQPWMTDALAFAPEGLMRMRLAESISTAWATRKLLLGAD